MALISHLYILMSVLNNSVKLCFWVRLVIGILCVDIGLTVFFICHHCPIFKYDSEDSTKKNVVLSL